MTNVKEIISLVRERMQGFQSGKDYSVSLESEKEQKKEVYAIHSPELKKVLRGVFAIPFSNESFSSAGYEEASCDSEGNCFSYKGKKKIDFSSDELLITSGLQRKQERTAIKHGTEIDKETLAWEEVEQRRREVERAREEVKTKRVEVEEQRKQGLPTGDYYSETSKINWDGKTWEKKISFEPDTNTRKIEETFTDSSREQVQSSGQEARQVSPLQIPFPKK